jgi:leucyl/phenylalanyl-tRNA--protein transferase
MTNQLQLPWLEPGEPFPDISRAWPTDSEAPGLLAAGGSLDTVTLVSAYSRGIFPWFSQGQPILWWSPDPRMLLQVDQFKLHRSLRKTIRAFRSNSACELRIDCDFESVIRNCAHRNRDGQSGTWIVPDMIAAYQSLHHRGHAHSIETWVDGELVGGLYCVSMGKAVFGESMFSHRTDASKIALAGLVSFCRAHGIQWIDCQQNTQHLASLGAAEMARAEFANLVHGALEEVAPIWIFDNLYWGHILET